MRVYPSRKSLGQTITIQGERHSIHVAKLTHRCMNCLSQFEVVGFGLKCSYNENHYGFITRDEAKKITEEVRLMNLGEMFPSEYLRGIDLPRHPIKVKIKAVTHKREKNFRSSKMEDIYIVHFEGMRQGLKLNVTMGKEIAKIVGGGDDYEVDPDNWIGAFVTLYKTKVIVKDIDHIVPRVRKPQRNDKAQKPEGQKKATPAKNGNGSNGKKKPDFPSGKAKEFHDVVQEAVGNYYNHPNHLLEVIGGHFNYADDDAWNEKLSVAVDHANDDDLQPEQAELIN